MLNTCVFSNFTDQAILGYKIIRNQMVCDQSLTSVRHYKYFSEASYSKSLQIELTLTTLHFSADIRNNQGKIIQAFSKI